MFDEHVANVISTGSPEIDKKMGGGIPVGSLTLIEGDSDSGKSVLSQQLISGALSAGRSVCVYTNENTTKSLLRQMDSLGLDVSDYFVLGRLPVFPLPITRETRETALGLVVEHASSRSDDLIIIDSITPYVQTRDAFDAFQIFQDCKHLCDQGKTFALVLHSHAVLEATIVRLRSMCDAHLRLRIEEVGDKLVKILEVAKVRGAAKTTGNVISFNVEPGMGMRIIPMSKAKA